MRALSAAMSSACNVFASPRVTESARWRACQFGFLDNLCQPTVHRAPLRRSRGSIDTRSQQRVCEPKALTVESDDLLTFGIPQQLDDAVCVRIRHPRNEFHRR
ncbi:hypothetical protein [Mycolicibacterium sp. NCC-Tsukiji]|uniref:hypothetical protein n=1 Tax=Mycolicibacterium sp. NCC-Tsukiji TaxID=2185272 RepID=UPI000EE3A30B|nr:hypothetical protein [Mycolicibacterium sp. NCC-Tsukiji]GCB01072.1 hypothetical protein NCCNTM_47060 [Mycolicibacterium sp. NCC-Tsukiji]